MLTKIFGDLTLVILFLLERFMPSVGATGLGGQSLSASLALVLQWQHGFCRFQLPWDLRILSEGGSLTCGRDGGTGCWAQARPGQLSLFSQDYQPAGHGRITLAAGFASSMACGLPEAELGPLIPRLGVSQGLWD